MKLKQFPALDLYVFGALNESSPVSLADYSVMDLDIPDGYEIKAHEANEEVVKVRQADESYYDLGLYDNSVCCRCPLAYEFSEVYF